MRACYKRISPDEDPFERVRTHQNYAPSWGTKKELATALRMLLTERVDHPEHDGITSLNKRVLAELIVAIRLFDENGELPPGTDEQPFDDDIDGSVPSRKAPPDSQFDNPLPVDSFNSYELYSWIVEHRSPEDGEHAVYVLDCTPPIGDAESERVKAFRQAVREKANEGKSLSKLEQAAESLNRDERLYYVGYAGDVPKRIREHASGADSGGAKLTHKFEPKALVEVTWYQSEATARQHRVS